MSYWTRFERAAEAYRSRYPTHASNMCAEQGEGPRKKAKDREENKLDAIPPKGSVAVPSKDPTKGADRRGGSRDGEVAENTSMTGPQKQGAYRPEEFLPLPPDTVRLGDRQVNAIGLGTLPLGVTYSGGGRPSKKAAVGVIHAALECGCNFIDTADVYCRGPDDTHYCERLIREALDSYPGDT